MGCGSSAPQDGVKAPAAGQEVSGGQSNGSNIAEQIIKTTEATRGIIDKGTNFVTNSGVPEAIEAATGAYAKATGAYEKAMDSMQKIMDSDVSVLKPAVDMIGKALQFLPEVQDILVTVANVVIPPPGGQVLGIILRIGALVVADGQNTKTVEALSHEVAKTMCVVYSKAGALDKHANVLEALEELRQVASKIEEFVQDVTQDKMWVLRLLTWTGTMEKLEGFEKQLQKGLRGDREKLARVAESLRGSGSTETKVIMEILSQVVAAQKDGAGAASYTLIRNRVIQKLWQDHFLTDQNIKWGQFWNRFPDHLPLDLVPNKSDLQTFFEDEANRTALKMYVEDMEDPDTLSIHEINTSFPDDVDLYQQASTLVRQFRVRGLGAREVLLCDNYVNRPCVELLAQDMKEARAVMVTGWPGEGKYMTACAAVLELKANKAVAAAYVVQLGGCMSADDIDSKLLCGLKPNKQSPGDKWDFVLTQLRGIAAMSTAEEAWPAVVIVNDLDEVPEQLMPHLIGRVKTALQEAKHLHVVLCTRPNIDMKLWDDKRMDPFKIKHFKLQPMSAEAAGNLLKAQVTGHTLEDADAQQLASNCTFNPMAIELMAKMINSGTFDNPYGEGLDMDSAKSYHVNMADKDGMSTLLIKAFQDMGKDCIKFFTLCDTFDGNLDKTAISKVLGGDSSAAVNFLNKLEAKHLLQPRAVMPKFKLVVPLIKGMVRAMLSCEDPEEQYPTLAEHIKAVVAARPKNRTKFTRFLSEHVVQVYKAYMTAPQSAYQTIVGTKDDIQMVFRWLAESEELCQDQAIRKGVIDILLVMQLTVSAFDQRAVQTACRQLAEAWEDDPAASGICRAVGALFCLSNSDPDFGKPMGLEQAKQAIDVLSTAPPSDQQQIALAMASRAKGLILRENNELDESIADLQRGCGLVQPLKANRQAMLEHIILMAELSGTLDYVGYKDPARNEEGMVVGRQAVKEADKYFNSKEHPIRALCLGSLGYNLRTGGKPQEALDMHNEAYTMRESTLGRVHPETAMSLNQQALSTQDLAKLMLDKADQALEGSEQRHNLRESAAGLLLQAEEVFEQSLEIRQKCLGPNHAMVANTMFGLAELHQLMAKRLGKEEKLSKAVGMLERTLDIRAKSFDAGHSKITQVRNQLVALYNQTGQEEKARSLQ